MNTDKRNALLTAVEQLGNQSPFYTEFESEQEGDEFVIEITIGVRPVVIDDYKRALKNVGINGIMLLAEFTSEERRIIISLVTQITVKNELRRGTFLESESPPHFMVFRFK